MSEIKDAIARLNIGFARLKGIGDADAFERDEIQFDEWDWEVGVGLYGSFRDAQSRGDHASLDRIGRWYDKQISRGLPNRHVNSSAPMLALACLAETSKRADWIGLCREWADWLLTDLPKTEEGGFEHVVKEGRRPGQLWDDTLIMAVLFLAQTGEMLGRKDLISEAHYQFLTHIRFLSDPETGLFFHGWSFEGRHNFARARWARGNAWVSIAIPELFAISPPTDPALSRYLKEVLETQIKAVGVLQRDDGMVHTLLDDPTGPVEASATAGFGYAVLAGIREGILTDEFRPIAEKALGAIMARIDMDGILSDVSDGTPMGYSYDFYNNLPNVAAPYGQALAILFLSHVERGTT